MAKRERSVNWDKEEKRLLRGIIEPFMHLIENKDISTNSNKAKLNAWLEITDRFNRVNKRLRNKKQIMNQWKISKHILKREIAQYRRRRQRFQAGGGLKLPSPGPDTMGVLEMIPQKFEIEDNEFDCDVKKENYQTSPDSQPTPSTSQPTYFVDVGQPTPSTSQPALLIKEPRNFQQIPNCSAKKKFMLPDQFDFSEASYEDMHKLRILENERQMREHECRIKSMAEIHNQVMINLKLQEEIYKKMLEKC